MNLKYLVCLFLISLCLGGFVTAKTPVKKKKLHGFKLIEAYSQRTLPGIPGAAIKTDYHFIIIWQDKNYPETFFWRGENGWLTCGISKAHKIVKKEPNVPEGMDYRTEQVLDGKIHEGDTLDIRPVAGGKFPTPAEIPVTAKNTLFYKTGGRGWLSFPVKNIATKHDIARQ
jgi:hypothetical protein